MKSPFSSGSGALSSSGSGAPKPNHSSLEGMTPVVMPRRRTRNGVPLPCLRSNAWDRRRRGRYRRLSSMLVARGREPQLPFERVRGVEAVAQRAHARERQPASTAEDIHSRYASAPTCSTTLKGPAYFGLSFAPRASTDGVM